MPARVVDGAGLWRSSKLKKMSPRYRGEYANLIPLAEANGVFDCDPDKVWSDVYAFNRPEVDVDEVSVILNELEDVDLLRRWSEKGKMWGYWVGIHKSGRLPVGTHLARYKHLPPNPPAELLSDDSLSGRVEASQGQSGIDPGQSGIVPAWFGSGLVRIGIGVEPAAREDKDIFSEDIQKETDMKAKKEIPVISERVLGVKAETWQSTWEEVKILEGAFGGSAVCRVFEEWAQTKRGVVLDKPVTEFLKIGRGLLAGIISLSPDTELSDLVDELVYLSRGTVKFTDAQQASLGKTLEKYPRSDIETAFKNFYTEIKEDAFKMGQAGKLFTETVGQEVKVALRMKQERTSEQTLMDAAREKMTKEANERVAEMLRKEAEEQEASETELS